MTLDQLETKSLEFNLSNDIVILLNFVKVDGEWICTATDEVMEDIEYALKHYQRK